jgi:hypothetical protein
MDPIRRKVLASGAAATAMAAAPQVFAQQAGPGGLPSAYMKADRGWPSARDGHRYKSPTAGRSRAGR